MKNATTVFFVVMMFCSLGLWGCSHQKNGAYHTKIRELENRYLKLEDDYKAMVQIGDHLRKKVGQIETQRAELNKQVEELKTVVHERDELRTQLATRTNERDQLHGQMTQVRRDIQDLLGRVDTALATPGDKTVPAIPTARQPE